MENPTVILTFHTDTYELDIDASELAIDFAISILERAKRILENQEKIIIAQQIRAASEAQQRTAQVLSRVKL